MESLIFAWTTWSKIKVSVLHFEDLDLWLEQLREPREQTGKMWDYVVTLPEMISDFPSTLHMIFDHTPASFFI